MANTYLKGALGFKGPRGYSAYEIAKQNGFVGSEEQWLASLGTVNNFSEDEVVYTTTQDNESVFDLPSGYTSNSVLEVYLDGVRLATNMYSINASTRKVTLTNPVIKGTKVEMVVLSMTTGALPISNEINAASTNDTTAGSKAVYDFVNATNQETQVMFINIANTKFDNGSIQTITGSVQSIAANETKTVDINYPGGFTKDNTHILSKMTSNNNVYYDSVDLTATANGFPVIKMVALLDDVIRVWLTNTNSTTAKIGYYKITLLKK